MAIYHNPFGDELPNATKVYKLSKQEYDTLLEASKLYNKHLKIGSFAGFIAGGIAARIKKFRPGATVLTCFVTTIIGSTIGSVNGTVAGYREIQKLPNKQNVYTIIRDLHQDVLKMKLPRRTEIKIERTDKTTNNGDYNDNNDNKPNQTDNVSNIISTGDYVEIGHSSSSSSSSSSGRNHRFGGDYQDDDNGWDKINSTNSKSLSSWDRIREKARLEQQQKSQNINNNNSNNNNNNTTNNNDFFSSFSNNNNDNENENMKKNQYYFSRSNN